MARWGPAGAVLLALLVAPALLACFAQPLASIGPVGRAMPGGHLRINMADERTVRAEVACILVSIDPDDDEDPTYESVCPRLISQSIVLAHRARGSVVLEWNGSTVRLPYMVPQGAEARTWAAVTDDGLRAGVGPTLVDPARVDAPWNGVSMLLALAFVGVLLVVALVRPLRWALALLAAATLLWIPIGLRDLPHVPGWAMLAAWGLLVADALSRMPDGPTDGTTPRPGP